MTGPGASERRVRIVNARGLHARAAAKFVKTAEKFDAEITVARAQITVGGQSIMGLMMLAAAPGTELVLKGEGAEAEAALEALCALVGRGFDEDDERS